ncbi:MAG: hypothetical protein JNL19_05705 [Burkholderiales bacterium]|nr:hypothetical protein [Burkholderiales bacterium]
MKVLLLLLQSLLLLSSAFAAGEREGFVAALANEFRVSDRRLPAGRYSFEIFSFVDCKIIATNITDPTISVEVPAASVMCRELKATSETATLVEVHSGIPRVSVVWFETYNHNRKVIRTVAVRLQGSK